MHRLLLHGAFWGGTAIFFVLYFGRGAESYSQSILFVALLLPVVMVTTYVLTGVLVPRFLLKGRYARFAVYGAYTLIASVYFELVVIVASFIFLAGYSTEEMNPATLDVFGLVVGFYVVVFLAVAGNLTIRWQRLRSAHEEMERARLLAELELREGELSRLKAQMQPHFLFNTLNNLYGLVLEKSDDAPEVVLRISELLDYVLYGCERQIVSLHGEVDHLNTYLELERLRYDERVEIAFTVVGELPPAGIAPLMLTPFVENSFKHGAARTNAASWVDIRLAAKGGRLSFEVRNGKPPVPMGLNVPERRSGIGLENVRRRLGLLYPEDHELKIDETESLFCVRLSIPLHPLSDTQEVRA